MANEVLIYGVKVEAGESIKKLAELKKQLSENAAEQKLLAAAYKEGTIAEEKYLQEVVKLQQAGRVLSEAQRKEQKDLDLITKSRTAANESNNQLKANLSLLTAQYNALSREEAENTEEGQKLQATIKGISDQLKKSEGGFGDNRRSVGGYTEGILEASKGVTIFGVNVGQLSDDLKGKLNTAVNITKAGFSSFNNLLKTSVIGLVIAALAGLVSYFKRTEEGAEKLEQIMSFLSGAFDVIIGRVAAFGKQIFEAFSNPIAVAEKLGNFLKLAFTNPTAALEQLSKGIQNAQIHLDDLARAAVQSGRAYASITKAAQELEDAQLAILPSNEKLKGQIEQLMLQARERGKSERERIAGLKEAGKLEEQLTKQRLQFAQEEMSLALRREQLDRKAGKLDNATRSEEAVQAEVKYQQILNESANQRQQIANRESGLMQELQADREKAQQDALEKQAALQLKQLQSEKAAIETRLLAVEQGSFAELKIREELLKKELQIELLNSELSKNQRILATAKVNHEIEKLEKERTDKQKAGSKEANKKMLDDTLSATEKAYNQMELNAKESLARQEISEEGYNTQLAMLHYQRLQTQLTDLQQYVGLVEGIEQQIADKQIEITNFAADQRIEANNRVSQNQIEKQKEQADRIANEAAMTEDFLASVGSAYADALDEQGLDTAKFAKNMLLLVIDTVEKIMLAQVAASIGTATVQSFAQPDSVATFGATGVVRAALLAGLIKAAFAVFKGAVAKFEDGGILQGPSHANGGIQLFNRSTGSYYGEAEGGEAILTKGVTSNPALLAAASAINVAAGGKPLTNVPFLNDGGLVSRYVSSPVVQQSDMNQTISQQIMVALENMPAPVVGVSEINRVQGKTKMVEVKTNI